MVALVAPVVPVLLWHPKARSPGRQWVVVATLVLVGVALLMWGLAGRWPVYVAGGALGGSVLLAALLLTRGRERVPDRVG